MVWRYQSGDNIPLDTLEHYLNFFIHDLKLSTEYLADVQAIADKYELPGEKNMLDMAKADVDVSIENIKVCAYAIAENKAKGH